MKRVQLLVGLLIIMLAFGCQSNHNINQSDIDQYEVKQTTDKKQEGDFLFRLVSEKEAYELGEEVKLYGELCYTGEKDEITITYGDVGISFSIEEKVRGYHIGDIIKDIGVVRDLQRNEIYRVTYTKSKFYMEGEDDSYNAFMEQFINEHGFPPGYYVVHGKADFAYNHDGNEEIKTEEIELEIDFKVGAR